METNRNEKFAELKTGISTGDRRSPRKLRLVCAAAIAVALAIFVPQIVDAQTTYNWNGSSSFWRVGTGWNPGGPPGANDIARFNLNIEDTVVWDAATGNRTTGSLDILQGAITFNNNSSTANQHTLTLNHGLNALEVKGPNTSFTLSGLHLNATTGSAWIDDGATMTLDGSDPSGATMTSGSGIYVGYNNGSGSSALNVNNGAYLNTNGGYLGYQSGSTGTVNVTGTNSQWYCPNLLRLGVDAGSSGNLNVSGGSVNATSINVGESGIGNVVVNNDDRFFSPGLTTVNFGSRIDIETGPLVVASSSSHVMTGFITAGLNVNGGIVDSVHTTIGLGSQTGTLNLTNNATLNSSGFTVGHFATGVLNVQSGSDVTNMGTFLIGNRSPDNSTATVEGSGSTLINTGNMYLGLYGKGILNVQNGGSVTNTGTLEIGSSGDFGDTYGTVTVETSAALNTGVLMVGTQNTGRLNINNGGTVTVGNTTSIGTGGAVTMNGGRFEFGTMSLASFSESLARIGGTSGQLQGSVINSAFTNISTLAGPQSTSLDFSEVNILNSGTLVGTGTLVAGFTNTGNGQIDAGGSSIIRFEGDVNVNNGRINSTGGLVSMTGDLLNTNTGRITNLGGQIVTEGQLTNQAGGLISGRGEFTAESGFVNLGSMAFSGGFTDVVGDVTNSTGALIVTSGGATTTFHEDVVHNGVEIRTSADSSSVFLGTVSGGGNYTGTGSVYFEGDLRPGNSPGIVTFGGDVIFGATAESFFEIGGLIPGVNGYDQLQIAGDIFLNNSTLNVSLIDGFSLGDDQRFLIASVAGNVFGQFAGYGEGARLGSSNLFITYQGFDSVNGIGLFTSSVPEPGSFFVIAFASMAFTVQRQRKRT
jgi:T5SS/PEP-CTERM-associated repeat protein